MFCYAEETILKNVSIVIRHKFNIPKLLTPTVSLTFPDTAHGSGAQRRAGRPRAERLGPPAAAPLLHLEPCKHQLTIGCPTILDPLCFLLFCQLLLYQNTKVGWVLKNAGNLLHDRHQNFENRFRNSWDNWGQSWQPLFRNLHFAIQRGRKIISMIKVATLISIISAISKSIFKILVPIM